MSVYQETIKPCHAFLKDLLEKRQSLKDRLELYSKENQTYGRQERVRKRRFYCDRKNKLMRIRSKQLDAEKLAQADLDDIE